MTNLVYWRLSGFYFLYFVFVGAFVPYWGLYLKSLEFSAFQIGVLMSLFQVARAIAPNVWGWLADHTGKRVRIIQLSALMSLVCYLGVFAGDSYFWLFVVMAAISFFWSAHMPLLEALTLGHLGANTGSYGRIRLWGSVGFIVSVTMLGYLLDRTPVHILLWIILAMKIGLLLFSRQLSEPCLLSHPADEPSVWEILKRPEVVVFFSSCFLMAVAHGAYNTFYSIYLVDHGYSKVAVGWLWAVGVICEMLVFLAMPRLTRIFGLKRILQTSFLLAGVRFLVIGWGVQWSGLILFAQTLHAASFGAYHAAAVALTHQHFTGKHQVKGQGYYTSISFGLGGTLGGLLSGWLWEPVGPAVTFTASALAALAGFVLLLWKLKTHHKDQSFDDGRR